MSSCMAGNLCLVCESSDLLTLPLLNCDWQAESREIDISAPDGSARSGFSGNGQRALLSPFSCSLSALPSAVEGRR